MTPSTSIPRAARGHGGVAMLPPNGGDRPGDGPRDGRRTVREGAEERGEGEAGNGGWDEFGFTPSGFGET